MPKIKPKKGGRTTVRKRKAGARSVSWYDKKYSTKELASKAWTAAKYVASLVNVETKIMDTGALSIANTAFTSTGTVVYLSGCAQGTDYNNRIGNSIKAEYLNLNMDVEVGSTNLTTTRLIIFKDRENRQSAPAVTDVLESADVKAHYNHNNLNRFTILYDDFAVLNTYKPNRAFAINKHLGTHIYYSGTGSTSASADEGSIWMLAMSNTASGATSPTLYYDARIGFFDN